MTVYRERLRASPWTFVATALLIPMSLLILVPISLVAGIVAAVLLYGAATVALIVSAPLIEVTGTEFRAGRARVPRHQLGPAVTFSGNDAFVQRGQRLDARAWTVLSSAANSVVKVPIRDPEDPAPYWLVSTRHPKDLAAALNSRPDVAGAES
ncbi:MAG: DUF3093 domain-containing protein [Microbacteriaceae bacterium]